MKLIPFEPGEFFDRLKKQLEGIFHLNIPDPMARSAADLTETERELILRWNLPGCQDIQVYVDKHTLTLTCTVKYEESHQDTRVSYSSQLRQKLVLPVRVRGELARTSYEGGIIEVRLDKDM